MRILLINTSSFQSGAEISLFQLLKTLDKTSFKIFTVLPDKFHCQHVLPDDITLIKMPLLWITKSLNPAYLIKYILSILVVMMKLIRMIRREKIKIVYANTYRSYFYVAFIKFFIPDCKLICHIRDNLNSSNLQKILFRQTDKIICVSEHIFKQVKAPEQKKQILYGAVDINDWNPQLQCKYSLRENLNLINTTAIIAQIGQLTEWKNHSDLIKAVHRIIKIKKDVHCIIVGDDLSGKEKKYKQKLLSLIEQLNLGSSITLLGYQNNIRELISQVDILIHPAIDEPFGRVITEAMAMSKPVIAYDCGGPKEIIVDNKTGYLVKPYDYITLGEKILLLLENRELQAKFGTNGRKRIIEKFSNNENIRKMEAIFNRL